MEAKTSSCNRNLFRADTPHAPKAEPLLLAAIGEGEEVLLGPAGPAWFWLVILVESDFPSLFLVSVDKLAALLSDPSNQKSSVTNGNQDISSESHLFCSFPGPVPTSSHLSLPHLFLSQMGIRVLSTVLLNSTALPR